MNNSSKTRTLITIIIFLLITNIAMLVFFILLGKPAKRQRNHETNGMYHSLQNDVGFTQDQLTRYQFLRKEQIQKVRPLFNEVRNAKKDFYSLIYSNNHSDSLINADADSIAQKQKILDMQMFAYFKNIRSICTSDQIQRFDSTLKKEVARMVGRPEKENQQQRK